MGIAESGGLASGVKPITVDEWISGGLDDLDVLETDALEVIGNELGGALDVALVLFEGADTGDAEEVFEFVKKALLVLFCVRDGLRRHWGNPLFTGYTESRSAAR
jgi:hypothetical protein